MNAIANQKTKPNYWLLLSAIASTAVLIWQWRTLLTTEIWRQPIIVPLIVVALLVAAGLLTWFLVKTVLFQRLIISELGIEFVDLLGNRGIFAPFHNVKLVRFYESDQGRAGRFQIVSITIASQNRKRDTKRFALLFLGTTQTNDFKNNLLSQVSDSWYSTVSVDSTRLSNPNFTSIQSIDHGEYPSRTTYWIFDIVFLGLTLLPLWFWR